MWNDYAFRLFLVETIQKADRFDLRLALAPMEKMSPEEQDLFKFMVSHSLQSYSQTAQDLWALYESKEPATRYFVEFGATNGVNINNTVLLERKYGWTGILAEPNPVWHKALQQNRTAIVDKRCVHSVTGETLEFINSENPVLGGIANQSASITAKKLHIKGDIIRVETVALNDLLEEHRAPTRIDFMSIDTEGWEYEILKTFDFKRWDVRLFSIELNLPSQNEAIDRLMKENGYARRFERFSGADAWYKKVMS